MDNWIESEEQEIEERKSFSIEGRRRIEAKKTKILANYEQNKEKFGTFMKEIFTLVDRVNNLPESKRTEFRLIEGKTKDNTLDNNLTIFSSSKRVELKLFTGLFSGYDNFKFKYVRVINFFISKEMGKFEVEYKESYNPKGHSKKYKKGRKHNIFRYKFDDINDKLPMSVIEWLAFRKEFEQISFDKKEFFRWKK